jgi:hypothetical protein
MRRTRVGCSVPVKDFKAQAVALRVRVWGEHWGVGRFTCFGFFIQHTADSSDLHFTASFYEFLDTAIPTALVLMGSIYVPENVTHIGHRLLEAIPVFIMIQVVFMDEFGCI